MSETAWFITGASSGLGYALAEHVLKQGERVAMGARTLGPMSDLAKRYPDTGLALKLDVTDADQRVRPRCGPVTTTSAPSMCW